MIRSLSPAAATHHLYIDESGTSGRGHPFIILGALEARADLIPKVRTLYRNLLTQPGRPPISELKWSTLTPAKLPAARAFVTQFEEHMRRGQMRFKAVVISREYLDPSRCDGGRTVLPKFAFQLVVTMAVPDRVYNVGLDGRSDLDRARVDDFEMYCNGRFTKTGASARVAHTAALDSKSAPLMQLSDLLTGLVGQGWNRRATSAHKLQLYRFTESTLGRRLDHADTYGGGTFNIWRWRPA